MAAGEYEGFAPAPVTLRRPPSVQQGQTQWRVQHTWQRYRQRPSLCRRELLAGATVRVRHYIPALGLGGGVFRHAAEYAGEKIDGEQVLWYL